MDSDQNRPQADGANPPPPASAADPGQDFPGEPDFTGFQPDVRESLLPRWLHLSIVWLLGLGAAAALVMAGMFVTQERKTDQTLELLAASSREERAAPAVPAVASVGEKKATDLVLLPTPETAAVPASVPAAQVPQGAVVTMPAEGAVADIAPAVTPAAPPKTKPVARKKKPKPAKQTTALAQQDDSQSWQRERDDSESWQRERRASQASQRERDDNESSQRERSERRNFPRRGESITEKLNAAVAACRARPHAPGECNLRACDILGKSDPACR